MIFIQINLYKKSSIKVPRMIQKKSIMIKKHKSLKGREREREREREKTKQNKQRKSFKNSEFFLAFLYL